MVHSPVPGFNTISQRGKHFQRESSSARNMQEHSYYKPHKSRNSSKDNLNAFVQVNVCTLPPYRKHNDLACVLWCRKSKGVQSALGKAHNLTETPNKESQSLPFARKEKLRVSTARALYPFNSRQLDS